MRKWGFHRIVIWLLLTILFIVLIFCFSFFAKNKHFVHDLLSDAPDIFSNYDEDIIVFSLRESPLLQYASDQWNSSHTSQVVYLDADDLWGENNWQPNQVRQEIEDSICQGKGPDLLILDSLGYLKTDLSITGASAQFQDVSYVFSQGITYSNVTRLYTNKEKTYAIPLRIIVPAVGGRNGEAVDSARTLNELTDSVLKKEPLNGIDLYQKILAGANIPQAEIVFNYADALPELYYPIWRNYIKKDESTSKDKYRNLIGMLQSIAVYNNLAFQEKSGEVPANNSPTNFMNSGATVFSDFITRGDNFIIPFYDFINNEHRNGHIDFISDPNGTKYCIPSTILAISSCADKISKDFLLFVLSDGIQSKLLGDGLPVNQISLERSITEASEAYNVSLAGDVLVNMSALTPIADIDSLREETTVFSETLRSYCLGKITFDIAYERYETASK